MYKNGLFKNCIITHHFRIRFFSRALFRELSDQYNSEYVDKMICEILDSKYNIKNVRKKIKKLINQENQRIAFDDDLFLVLNKGSLITIRPH